MLTSVNLLALADITVAETLRMSPARGVLAVLEGQADAVIYVSGKPVKLFKNIEHLKTADGKKFSALLEQVHFIPITNKAITAEYKTATIGHDDYDFMDGNINTIAVQAVLVTGNYREAGRDASCKCVAKAAQAIRTNIRKLKKAGHPKWQHVNTSQPIALWQKDDCSWPKSLPKNNPRT